MNHPQLSEIGVIRKTHGVNGEVQVNWTHGFNPDETKLESVFLQIEGIPIPFFIKSIRNKGAEDSLILLDEIETIEQANPMVGLKVFADVISKTNDDELYLDDLVGYTIVSSIRHQIGIVEELQDYSGNLVFQVINNAGSEVLIPASSDLIIEINEESKTIIMEIPEGLMEL